MLKKFHCLLLPLFSAAACNVVSVDTTTTGAYLGADGAGFIAIATDYQSAAVSVLNGDGELVSQNLISSASVAPGLSAALSGDVVPPSQTLRGDELVLIDRSGPGVLTWVGAETSEVRAQLNVGTGFAANPHDYVAVSATKAYVTRFAGNLESGREPFDAGSDVLVIDPSQPAILGHVDLVPALQGADASFQVGADRALFAGGRVRVLATGLKSDFSDSLPARVISIDPATDSISQVLVLEGLRSCITLALSPNGKELALGCSGTYGQDPALGFPDSGIVLLDVAAELSEKRRFAAAGLGGEQIGAISYANATSLVFTTSGRFSADQLTQAAPDTLRRLDLASGALAGEPLLTTRALPFSLGDVRCAAASAVCLATDAETEGGVLHRFDVASDGSLVNGTSQAPNPALGLPPRYLGAF